MSKKTAAECPSCGARFRADPVTDTNFPFCSARCRLIDLGVWLDEGYAVDRPVGRDGTDDAVLGEIDPEVRELLGDALLDDLQRRLRGGDESV
jgi:endogenous inhibitor of DNA gyrase (YacG/DUF329 family)